MVFIPEAQQSFKIGLFQAKLPLIHEILYMGSDPPSWSRHL
jgi:hypothetical protein